MLTCEKCGRPLGRDEVGLTRKLVNRGATQYLCYECLARTFEVTREELERKVREFREMGCTLFL